MELHRIIPIAPFVADPDWSATQVAPPQTVIATALGGSVIGPPQAGGRIYWVAIPYDGDTEDSSPTDGTGLTFDGRLVYPAAITYKGAGTKSIVVARKSPGEVEGAPIPVGREIFEGATKRGMSGTIQMLSVAGASPATHLWIFWGYESEGG